VLSILAKDLANSRDILAAANKRGKDHVNIVLDTKPKIGLVLLGKCREIDIGVWEVDTLLRRDHAIVTGTHTDGVGVDNFEDIKRKNTVVDIDNTASLNDFGDVLVVDIPGRIVSCDESGISGSRYSHVLIVAACRILVISGNVELCSRRDGDVLVVGSVAGSDLRALGVQGNGDLTALLDLLSLAGMVDHGLVVFV
jgi:hypothetical protein